MFNFSLKKIQLLSIKIRPNLYELIICNLTKILAKLYSLNQTYSRGYKTFTNLKKTITLDLKAQFTNSYVKI